MNTDEISTADLISIYDRLHFCKFLLSSGPLYIDDISHLYRFQHDNIFTETDNFDYDKRLFRNRNRDLLQFYEHAALFMDVLLADKLWYCGSSFCADNSFQYVLNKDDEDYQNMFPDAENQYGKYTKTQLHFILDRMKQYDEKYNRNDINIGFEAEDFVLNCVLNTGKYPMEQQLNILMDDAYCEYLEAQGRDSFR